MNLKICGIRTIKMFQLCLEAKIPYIGFNFVPTSRRKVSSKFLESLPDKQVSIKYGGVFQDQPLEEVKNISEKYSLDFIQLHGNESLEYIQSFANPIVKGISLKNKDSLKNIEKFCGNVPTLLLDGANPGSGNLAANNLLSEAIRICRKFKQPFALAGGINSQNLRNFSQKYPDSVFFDTASGVEDLDGNFSSEIFTHLITQTL